MNRTAVINTVANIINGWKKRPYLRLSVYIVITSLILYWQFIFGENTFVFNDTVTDTHHQYVPVYNFFASAIKSGTLSTYTFQSGYGNSIFSIISQVSNPFSMISVLVGVVFGEQYIADSIIYVLILKHIFSGLLCLYYLKGFNFSKKNSMIVAFMYAFNGYISSIGANYNFATNPIYFILVLIALENIIKKEHKLTHWVLLTVSSTLIAASSIVSAYQIFFAAALYALFRVIYIYGKNIKKILTRLGICLIFVVGGVCISSFILLPVIFKIGGSSRLVHSGNYFSLYDPSIIRSSFIRLFSPNLEGAFNSFFGGENSATFKYYTYCFPVFFSVMLVPMAAQFIWYTFRGGLSVKQRVFRLIPVGFFIFSTVDKFSIYFFNFFVMPQYHGYIFIFLPLFAVLFADVMDKAKSSKFSRKINYLIMIICVGFIIFGGLYAYERGSTTSMHAMMFSIVMLVVGCIALDVVYLTSANLIRTKFNHLYKSAYFMLAACLVLNTVCENYIPNNYKRASISKKTEHKELFTSEIVNNVNNVEKDNFFRFETNYYEGRVHPGYTYPFIFPIRATAYYDNAINNGVPYFYYNMSGTNNVAIYNNYWNYSSTIRNTITEDILGIKYIFYAGTFERNGWKKIESYPERRVSLYQNMGINSAGLLFDSYITREEAKKDSAGTKALGMATRLILDDPVQNINTFASKLSSDKFPNSVFKEKSKNNAEDIINDILNIDSVLPYAGTVYEVTETEDGYNIQAEMDGEDSNFRFSLNTDTVNDFNKLTTISFRLDNGEVLKNFVYFDSDNSWKSISYIETESDGDETIYSFAVPQTASELAFCVNQACDLDIDIFSKTIDISGEAFNISTAAPYEGTITNINFDNNKYNVKATMNTDESNFRFYLNTDVVNDSNSFSQISFRMKNSDVLKNFLYFDADNSWKEITNLAEQSEGEETVYTFTIPQAASCLALCVNKPCTLDVDISTKIFDISGSAFKVGTAAPYLGSVDNIGITDDGYNLKATMNGKDSNFRVYLNTDILNDSKKSTLITFKLKNNSVVDKFVYFDTDNQWKTISVRPTQKNDVSEYSFIIPQTASCLAMSVKKACKLDVDISVKTVTATYINEGIHLDNPKRGDTLSGTVTAEKNSLLYLPVPYSKDWNAYIDGEKVDIMKANYAFMAVPVTEGKHTVSFVYSNRAFKIGLVISVTTFVLMNGFFAICFIAKHKKKKEEEIHDIF